MADSYNIMLVRYDPYTSAEMQREIVYLYTEGPSQLVPPIGAVLGALSYTTSVVGEGGAIPGQYNIVMVRNDPFTEVEISRTVVFSGFVEDPEAQYPTVDAICYALRSRIFYWPELVDGS